VGSSLAIILTRETHLETLANGGKYLADDATNQPLLYGGVVTSEVDLFELPLLGKDFNYHDVTDVTLAVNDNQVVGFRVDGFHWQNSTSMKLYLSNGLTLQIVDTEAQLVSTTTIDPSTLVVDSPDRRRLVVPILVIAGKLVLKGALGGAGRTVGAAATGAAISRWT